MSHRKRYASSTDVARLAGVSQSAVSRVYRPDASVSPEMRRKVLAAAAELDYRPSAIPRIMLTHRSNLVAIVIGGMYNPFYATVLERFTVRLQEAGHQVLLVHVDSGHSLDAAIPRLASYRVDAIVSALSVLLPRSAEELARFRIPVVSFNTAVNNEWVSSVCCDNVGAGRDMADHLLARGASRFGYIAGPAGSPANQERLAGFRARLAERGVTHIETSGTAFDYPTGYAPAIEMFDRPDRPDAVFCANDPLAMGAIGSSCRPGSWNVARRAVSPYVALKPPSTWSDTPVVIAARSERRIDDRLGDLIPAPQCPLFRRPPSARLSPGT